LPSDGCRRAIPWGRAGWALAASLLLAGCLTLSACGGATSGSSTSQAAKPASKAASSSAPSSPSAPAGGSSQAAKAPLQTVQYGILGVTTAEWPLYIAEANGYFKQQGIQLHTTLLQGPVNVAQALATGSLDIAGDGTDTWVRTVSGGLPVKVVAPGFITDPYTLIVPASVHSWSQLKGKTISLGTTTDVTAISFYAMAQAHGMTAKDFTYATAGSTNARYAALQSGHVQGALLTQPFDLQAISKGFSRLATSKQYVPNWVFTTYAVNTNWAASHRQQIVGFIRALMQGAAYGYAHPAAAEKLIVAKTGVSQALAQQAYNLDFTQWHAFSRHAQVSQTDLNAVIQAVLKQGTISHAPSLAQLYDGSYVKAAAQAQG
jgi:NitT/TauT family transport system substrate-binding protein